MSQSKNINNGYQPKNIARDGYQPKSNSGEPQSGHQPTNTGNNNPSDTPKAPPKSE